MANEKDPERYDVDFATFHPTPRGTFHYRGTAYAAWSPFQLGQSSFAKIDGVGAALKAADTIEQQYAVIIDAILVLVPGAPADCLRDEPFEALSGAFASLVSDGKPVSDTARPMKAGRKKSGSRRTTAR
jgi:hypothetical protein